MSFDFEKDILIWSNRAISRLGYKPSGKCEASYRLSQVFNILRNRIPPTPRAVEVAKGFNCPQSRINGYKQVVSEIERGDDLTPRCSRRQAKKTNYIDPMLLDWGIHHIHLGTKEILTGKNKGLIQGHKEILFAFITDEKAHIIGVFDHTSWAKKSVLKIVYNNWPHLLEPWRLKRDLELSREPADADIRSLREAYINSLIKIGNDIYLGPGGGITTAGTGLNETHKSNMVLRAADDLRDWVNENINSIEKHIKSKLGPLSFDVSRYILSNKFSISAPRNNLRIFIPSTSPVASLIHPAQASSVEPIAENYHYHNPGSFSGIMIKKLVAT
ncbi:hypothetical protein [Marichromatium purpuratum]|uniref:hypothetical protein n=1 Tax=Marichromatium purpuratum TaxID=37487 RepID=UPI00021E7146|nr:hypothetical protein [Marichromatium purpuratum]